MVMEQLFSFENIVDSFDDLDDGERREWSRLVGGRHGRRLQRILREGADAGDHPFNELIHPRLSFTIRSVEGDDGATVRLENGVSLTSSKLAWVLEDCPQAVCFVATIGPVLDCEIERLTSEQRLSGVYLLDRVGSLAIEAVVTAFHREMAERFGRKGRGVTMRFSPGYCDWSLAEQRKLFSLVDTKRIGVSLSPSLLMRPRKSISGIFGILDGSRRTRHVLKNPCTRCDRRHCPERRSIPSYLFRGNGPGRRTGGKETTGREN
jgi:hypothetical protein